MGRKVDVMIVDPLSVVLTGPATTHHDEGVKRLDRLCKPIIDAGVTPVLVHHSLKNVQPGEYLGIEDIQGAGIGANIRSWLLVNRRAKYAGNRVHDLMAEMATAEGDSDCVRMDVRIDERRQPDG